MKTNLCPGREVELTSGHRGVLYARTWAPRKRFSPAAAETWYFLPDVVGVAGVVVLAQPREISDVDVAKTGALRAGRWPSSTHWLDTRERQAVYAAHMQGRQLPQPIDDAPLPKANGA